MTLAPRPAPGRWSHLSCSLGCRGLLPVPGPVFWGLDGARVRWSQPWRAAAVPPGPFEKEPLPGVAALCFLLFSKCQRRAHLKHVKNTKEGNCTLRFQKIQRGHRGDCTSHQNRPGFSDQGSLASKEGRRGACSLIVASGLFKRWFGEGSWDSFVIWQCLLVKNNSFVGLK